MSNNDATRQSSHHHGFDPRLARLYGVPCAVLIDHFKYHINSAARRGVNYHDRHTWVYQTLDEIASHYEYYDRDQVKRTINKLVEHKILLKGNYNKSTYDRTVWYAFNNEELFSIWRNRQMDVSDSPDGNCENATPIPITITITNNTPPNPQTAYASDEAAPFGGSSPDVERERVAKQQTNTAKKQRNKPAKQTYSTEVVACTASIVAELKRTKPDMRVPADLSKWHVYVDQMIRIDKRTPAGILAVLIWALADNFWRDKMYSPNTAAYLRKQYDHLDIKRSPSAGHASIREVIPTSAHLDMSPIEIKNRFIWTSFITQCGAYFQSKGLALLTGSEVAWIGKAASMSYKSKDFLSFLKYHAATHEQNVRWPKDE